jgi:hypothetical protein
MSSDISKSPAILRTSHLDVRKYAGDLLWSMNIFNVRKVGYVQSKAWVCGYSPAEIVGSNHTGVRDDSLLRVLCVVRLRSRRRADHSSRRVLPSVERRCV